ncbi:TPA: hypothetical protein R1706_001347 [Campylobacter lari]|nr:hypothetical protein [Campylobacter lari]
MKKIFGFTIEFNGVTDYLKNKSLFKFTYIDRTGEKKFTSEEINIFQYTPKLFVYRSIIKYYDTDYMTLDYGKKGSKVKWVVPGPVKIVQKDDHFISAEGIRGYAVLKLKGLIPNGEDIRVYAAAMGHIYSTIVKYVERLPHVMLYPKYENYCRVSNSSLILKDKER